MPRVAKQSEGTDNAPDRGRCGGVEEGKAHMEERMMDVIVEIYNHMDEGFLVPLKGVFGCLPAVEVFGRLRSVPLSSGHAVRIAFIHLAALPSQCAFRMHHSIACPASVKVWSETFRSSSRHSIGEKPSFGSSANP